MEQTEKFTDKKLGRGRGAVFVNRLQQFTGVARGLILLLLVEAAQQIAADATQLPLLGLEEACTRIVTLDAHVYALSFKHEPGWHSWHLAVFPPSE